MKSATSPSESASSPKRAHPPDSKQGANLTPDAPALVDRSRAVVAKATSDGGACHRSGGGDDSDRRRLEAEKAALLSRCSRLSVCSALARAISPAVGAPACRPSSRLMCLSVGVCMPCPMYVCMCARACVRACVPACLPAWIVSIQQRVAHPAMPRCRLTPVLCMQASCTAIRKRAAQEGAGRLRQPACSRTSPFALHIVCSALPPLQRSELGSFLFPRAHTQRGQSSTLTRQRQSGFAFFVCVILLTIN